jgi:hypothetical protein
MELRKDPAANAVMGGAITLKNAAVLSKRIGRQPSDGELYIAHFFGPYAAAKLITLASSDPQVSAVALFPRAAAANRPIFYDKQGNARSVSGVYAELVRRYEAARASPGAGRAIAAISPAPPTAFASAAASDEAAVNAPASALSLDQGAAFHSLFQTDQRHGPVSPLVASLWGLGPSKTQESPVAPATFAGKSADKPAALDLFRDSRPNARGLFDGSA